MNEPELTPKAAAMLDAHVAFVCRRLTGGDFESWVRAELEANLHNARRLTLLEVVNAAQIKETVHRYALELEPGAGILELIGAIARHIYVHPVHRETRLGDILDDRRLEEFLDKVLEMRNVRESVLRELVANPVYAELAGQFLYTGILGYLGHTAERGGIPGGRAALRLGKALWRRLPERWEETVEHGLQGYLERSLHLLLEDSAEALTAVDTERLRESILDIWVRIRDWRVAEGRSGVSELDVEEFFVIGYEYWRDFRQTAYCRAIIDAGVDAFFSIYGDFTLYDLLEEIGIDEEMMVNEALHFAPHILQVLHERHMLAPLVRRQLVDFYASADAAAFLGEA